MSGTKIEYEVTDGGSTKKLTSAAGLLKQGLDDVTATAVKAGTAVKAAMAPSGGSKTKAALQSASQSPADLLEYNQAKGIAGATGAAGRDFAKQAQGLGGLVHVYATFAANLFAVGAAFRALSAAADTTNMIKGLDQLGAASGKSLGTLSKQIADTTGGALSLRDAMTSVAQASSAGLGNKQIKDLASVAAKASNALGISMTDAVSRLSRGISKIEPELLDELGIFIKVDEATNKYALSVGKTVGSLSDFEKRQAFANAVLEQGKDKFAAIEAAPNPYDKLIASISNLGQSGLELINKVLSPIVKLLAESPLALTAVFAGIATVLLKQAIPAIGQFREGMRKSAEDALKSAEAFKNSFGDRFQGRLEQRFKLPDLQAEVKKFEESLANIKLPSQLGKGGVGRLIATVEEDPRALAAAEKALALRNKQIETGMKGTKEMSDAQKAAAKQERDDIQSIIGFYKKKLELIKATEAAQGVADKPLSKLDPERIAQKRYENLRNAAKSAGAVAAAAETAQVTGVRDAWRELNTTIEKDGITGLTKYTTLAKGGIAAVSSRIMGLAAAFGPLAEAAGIAIAVMSTIDSVLSQATKQQEEYNTKVEATHEAVKTVDATFDLYTVKRKAAFSIEGIVAFNTALAGTADAFKDQLEALEAYRKASGIWDVLKDTVSSMWGGSNLQKAKKSATESVLAVLKSLEFSSGKGQAVVDIAGAIGIDPSKVQDTVALKKAISELNESDLGKLSEQFKKIEEREQFSTNAAKAFIESLTAIDKIVDQMIQANAFSDLQGKLGVELVNAAQKFAQALQDPLKALLDIEALAKDPKALAVLGNVNIKQIFEATKAIKDLNEAELDLTKATERKSEETYKSNVNIANAMDASGLGNQIQAQAQEIADANYNEAVIKLGLLKAQAQKFAQAQADLIKTITDEGFKRVMLGLKLADEQANITVEKAKMAVATSAGLDTSAKEYDLRIQEIGIQKRLVDASYEAQMATMKNTETLNELTATQQILAAEALKAKGGTADEVKANAKLAESMTKAAQKTLDIASARGMLKDNSPESKVEAKYGKPVLSLAKSAIESEKIPAIQREAAQAKLRGDAEVAAIEKITKQKEYDLKLSLDKKAVDKESLTTQLDLLNTAAQLNSYSSDTLINSKLEIQQKLLDNDVSVKRIQLEAQLEKIEREKKSATDKSYKDQKQLIETKLTNLEADQAAKKLALDISAIREKGAAKQAEITFKTGIEIQNLQTGNSIIEARINFDQKRLDAMAQMGMFDEQTVIRLKAQAELQLQNLKYSEQAARLAADVQAKQIALDTARDAQAKAKSASDAAPGNVALSQALGSANTAVTNAQAALDASKQQQDSGRIINDLTTESIKKQDELNQKFAQQKAYLSDIANLGTALGGVFGDVGTKIGGVISNFEDLGTKQLNAAAGIKDLGEQAAAAYKKASQADDTEERDKYIKEGSKALADQSRLQDKADRDAVAGSAKVLGATKNLFKEKTVAYKLFATLEKATQLASLAMELKVSAGKIGAWITEVTVKGMTEAQKTAFETAGFFSRLPLYISSIYGSTIGQLGPIAGPVVATALIATFLGKFVGSKAAPGGFSASDQQKVQGTGQTYDANGNLVTRSGGVFGDPTAIAKSIETSISELDKSFYGIFDSSNSKMLIALRGIQDNTKQTAAALLQGSTGLFGGVNPFGFREGKASGFLGFSSTSASIEDEGIRIQGLLGRLARGIGDFSQYINTKVVSSSWWGLSKSTSFNTALKDLRETAPAAVRAIQKTFSDVTTALNEGVNYFYGENSQALQTIQNFNLTLKTSSKGLSASEFAQKLTEEINVQLNAAAEAAMPDLVQFRRIGEEMWQTVARVMKSSQAIKDGFAMIGLANKELTTNITETTTSLFGLVNTTTTRSLSTLTGSLSDITTIQQTLIDQAGGVDNVASGLQNYFDNFLDSSTRYNLTLNRLRETFRAAGMELPRSKQEFTNLMQTVTDTSKLAVLINSTETYNNLLSLQAEANKDQIDTLTNSINAFKDFAKNVRTFRDSLIFSASSLATPFERYTEAKRQFESTYTAALGGDKDAMGKLTTASQTFLDASKSMYASSDTYATDYSTVIQRLTDAGVSADASVDVAQLQLDAINSSVDYLASIDANIANLTGGTTAAVTAHAAGGMASGWSLVGEKGAELVDFNTPGRVYTADQTAGMFADGPGMSQSINAMVVEIQSLREEVTQLRKDQQKQTGDLIISNYDANQKAAEEVANAVTTASADSTWTERSKSQIK